MNEVEVRRYLGYLGIAHSDVQNRRRDSPRHLPNRRLIAIAIALTALLLVGFVGRTAYSAADGGYRAAPRSLPAAARDVPVSHAAQTLLTPIIQEELGPLERELKVFTYLFTILLYDVASGSLGR